MTTQLRRYEVKNGQMDRFLGWIPKVWAARALYGFTVDSAAIDRDNNEFIWTTSHPDDYLAALEVYNASPERAAVFDGWESALDKLHVSWVEPVIFVPEPDES